MLHLHGEIFKMRSTEDESLVEEIRTDILLGDLASDGAQWRPHIVWFEEPVPMIEEAARVMQTANVFILVGTSLQVYPAAGLINFVPADVPKYIVDKKIPAISKYPNLILVEKPATEGMAKVFEELIN